jgi:hypothetical protein
MKFAIAALAALALTGASAAAWSASTSGTAQARAGQLIGNAPTATKTGAVTLSINLSWSATPGATGYRIQRSGGVGTVGGTCTGTLTATSCSDTPVAPLTTYTYSVTPLAGTWTGTASAGTSIST